METAPDDAETRRGLKTSAELPSDDSMRDREEHLDEDVPIVTPIVPQTERTADTADAHMSMSKFEMVSSAAAKMMNSAATCELTCVEI